MLKARVIPCLDVKDGRVVKGVNFVDLRDAGDPVDAAIAYDAAGADELCFLDITASHEDRDVIFDVVSATAEHCFMPLTVGGGVRSVDDVRKLLLAGADKVSINTAAVRRPELVQEASHKFGAQCIVVAIDAKRVSDDGEPLRWEIFTHGGREKTGIDFLDGFLRCVGVLFLDDADNRVSFANDATVAEWVVHIDRQDEQVIAGRCCKQLVQRRGEQ